MHLLSLPRELIDMIIDHLHYDRLSLAFCCLVCKAWLPASRYHLLSDVRIDYLSLTSDRIARTQKLSSVAKHVRRLMICHLYPLPQGLEIFSSITSLFIYGCPPYPEMRLMLPSLASRITYVEYNNVRFNDFAEMIDYSCCFPQLQTLNLSSTWELDKEPQGDLRLPSSLQTLNIQSGLLAFLPWLTERMPPDLTTLRLFRLALKHISLLEDVLDAAGRSLKHLELGLRTFMDADPFIGKFDFSNNAQLRCIVLHNAPLILFHSVLENAMENTRVEEAHLITGYDEKLPCSHHVFWSTLDCLIADSTSNQHLSNLTFRLDVVRDDFRDRIVKEINTCLPLCSKNGIVKFLSEKDRISALRQRMTGPISSRTWGDSLVY